MYLFLFLIICITSGNAFDFKSHLTDPEWHQVIDERGIHIGPSRSKRFVQLTEDQPDVTHQACILPDGRSGHCRPLRYCIQEDFRNNFVVFMDYLCVIQQTVIGACCPDTLPTDGADSNSLGGDLPATAPLNEPDVMTRITRAESRGCGLSTRATTKLVGARPANPREWPWMASITPEGFAQYCGGVLITDRHVLTAAHCTRRWKADDLSVRLGEYDLVRTNDSRSYNFKVVEIRQHEQFELPSYHNDIAILKLHRPAVFNTYVWPICMPPLRMSNNLVNQTAYVIGWGTQWFGGPRSDVLMEVSVPVWDHQQCVANFAENVFDSMLCAGGYEGGRDACQGDSGGPLMYQMSSGRWTVIGVVSWGVRCGEKNHPGLYTKVDDYLPWIVDNVRF